MSDAVLANTLFQRADGLIELLESKDIDTKENAGRAIAMLFEATYSEEDNLDKKQAKHLERLIDTITGMLDAMASVSTKSQNKKDNKRYVLNHGRNFCDSNDGYSQATFKLQTVLKDYRGLLLPKGDDIP
eukprot:1386131-Amorphochlora_amoeboformis.AAC.3